MLWHVHHIFHLVVFKIWCMKYYKIVLSHMTSQVISIFILGMWAHCSWSCSPIHITFVCGITIINFGKANQQYLTHCDWRSDISTSRPHTCYSIQGYIYEAFLILTNLKWQHKANVKQWPMWFTLGWITFELSVITCGCL